MQHPTLTGHHNNNITFLTHYKCHTFDVLTTFSNPQSLRSVTPVESYLSDYVAVFSKLDFPFKTTPNYKIVKYTSWHWII